MPHNIEIFGGPRFLEARCGRTIRPPSGPALLPFRRRRLVAARRPDLGRRRRPPRRPSEVIPRR